MKIALVYDRVNKFGGAERVLTALHQIWPEAPLYTAVYNPSSTPWARGMKVISSWLQQFPLAKNHHELYPWLTPLAFESFDFHQFDVVLSVTSAEAKAVITRPETLHLCYCLTPTRYLWSHQKQYLADPGLGGWSRPARWGLKLLLPYLKKLDLVTASRPDQYLTISETTKRRVKRYYQREAEVIYPPVDCQPFGRPTKVKALSWLPEDYWLMVSRLVSYKRVRLAIKAFNKLKLPLIIVGSGRQESELKKLAKKNIIFLGKVNNRELIHLYQRARALVMPQEEDFGLVAVEANASGTPVVAVNKGGARETVVDGKTGILFSKATVDSLIKAVKKSRSRVWDQKLIRSQAQKFDTERFRKEINKLVETAWLKHQQ